MNGKRPGNKVPAPIFTKRKPRQPLLAHPNNSNSENDFNGSYTTGGAWASSVPAGGPNRTSGSGSTSSRSFSSAWQTGMSPPAPSSNGGQQRQRPLPQQQQQQQQQPNTMGTQPPRARPVTQQQINWNVPSSSPVSQHGGPVLSRMVPSPSTRQQSPSGGMNQRPGVGGNRQTYGQDHISAAQPPYQSGHNNRARQPAMAQHYSRQSGQPTQKSGFDEAYNRNTPVYTQSLFREPTPPYDVATSRRTPAYASTAWGSPAKPSLQVPQPSTAPSSGSQHGLAVGARQNREAQSFTMESKKSQVDCSLRVITTTIKGMKHWSLSKTKAPMIFEVLGVLNSAVVADEDLELKEFNLKDDNDVIKCVFFEIDRQLPRMTRGQWHRCVGSLDRDKSLMKCISVRAVLAGERQAFTSQVAACDGYMRQWLSK